MYINVDPQAPQHSNQGPGKPNRLGELLSSREANDES